MVLRCARALSIDCLPIVPLSGMQHSIDQKAINLFSFISGDTVPMVSKLSAHACLDYNDPGGICF